MSPTVFRERGFRFYFFSREEPRMHVHVYGQSGEAKVWLEPNITVACSFGLADAEVKVVVQLVEEHEDEIRTAWRQHFRR